MLKLEDKKAVVSDVNELAQVALSAVVADYRGSTVEQFTTLRKGARKSGVCVKVVRNTLAKRAVVGTQFECLVDSFVGPTVILFSKEDPGSSARVVCNFLKESEIDVLKVRALSIDGKLLSADKINSLAELPTIDEARGQLLAVMLAPMVKLARLLNEIPSSVTRVMAAVAEKKKLE